MTSSVVTFGRMIKFSHSIFAMPFAIASGLLATRAVDVPWTSWLLVVLCMVTARSSAMGFNRLVDRDIDARNPRTAIREIPSGQISVPAAWGFTLGSAALFVAFAALLGTATLILSPVALLVVWGYSLTKRFTSMAHLVLGVALAIAPTAVWIAFTGGYSPVPLLLSVAVGTWVAGFDLIYACQDADFDRGAGLYSIPSRFGVPFALGLSVALHVVTLGALAALPSLVALGPAYWVGLALIGAVLAYEHAIVTPSDLSRVNKAFFDLNGYVSLVFLGAVALA
jgi:4-hydroxybenzoate polyprenyltransferase